MTLFALAAAVLIVSACAESLSTSMHKTLEAHKRLSQSQHSQMLMPESPALNNMEASLLSMAKEKIESGDSETAANLTTFLDQIQAIIDQTMKTSILTRYNASQQMLDSTWANYTSPCSAPGDAPFSQYTSLNDEHVTCRGIEQTFYQSYTSCLSDESVVAQAAQLRCSRYTELNSMPRYANLCQMPANMAAPTIGNYLIYMEEQFKQALGNLSDARDSCQNVTTTNAPTVTCTELLCDWKTKQYECDTKQQNFENQACLLSRSHTCSTFTTCWNAKKNAYDQAAQSANATQPGLKAEWRAVMRIDCLIDALGVPAAQLQSQIDACIARTHSTIPVTFTFYGPTTAPTPCNQANFQNMTPGNAAFSTRWYAGISSAVSATVDGRLVGLPMTCASSTCDCWNGTAPSCVTSSSYSSVPGGPTIYEDLATRTFDGSASTTRHLPLSANVAGNGARTLLVHIRNEVDNPCFMFFTMGSWVNQGNELWAAIACKTRSDMGLWVWAHNNDLAPGISWSRTSFTRGEWHHVGITWDGNMGVFYYDGAEVGRTQDWQKYGPAYGGFNTATSEPASYGGYPESLATPPEASMRPFKGAMKGLRIYDKALSAEEVNTVMSLN